MRFYQILPATIKQTHPLWFEVPALTPQTTILGVYYDSVSNVRLINHVLLLFKLYIYKSWNKHRYLTHSFPMYSFSPPLMFSRVGEKLHCERVGWANILKIKKLGYCFRKKVWKVTTYNRKWNIINAVEQGWVWMVCLILKRKGSDGGFSSWRLWMNLFSKITIFLFH